MPQLLLLRHAKAAWDEKRFADRERPLNARGERAAEAIGRAMATLGLTPELVLASPAERCVRTLACLGLPAPPARIASAERLYLAGANAILGELRRLPDATASVLVIGHNPGLHDFARLLRTPERGREARRLDAGFPTAALAVFDVGVRWCELAGGSARLVRFLVPGDPPESAERIPFARNLLLYPAEHKR